MESYTNIKQHLYFLIQSKYNHVHFPQRCDCCEVTSDPIGQKSLDRDESRENKIMGSSAGDLQWWQKHFYTLNVFIYLLSFWQSPN